MILAGRLSRGLVVVLLLPLVSHCGKKEGPVRSFKLSEVAKLDQIYGPGKEAPAASPEDIKAIMPQRAEALGDMLLSKREYENSLASYLQVLKDQPERHDVRYKVGVILLLSGKYEAARQEFNRVLQSNPNMVEAREGLGLACLQSKQNSEAIQEFRTTVSQEPQRAKSRYLLGLTYLIADRPREAIPELETAIRLESRNPAPYVTLGQAYLKLNNYSQAAATFKRGLDIVPDNKKLNYQMGMALSKQKRYEEAFTFFLKGGDEAQAYNNIGVHYFVEGKYEEAAKCFQKALDLRPVHYQEAKVNLDRALEKLQTVTFGKEEKGKASQE